MSTKNPIIIALVLLVVGSSGAAAYFYYQLQQAQVDPQIQAQQNVDNLIAKVGKLMVLPEDERPTVATVSDVEQLREQPFFAKAKNGDRVLIYTNARRVILYDPIVNKIVEVAPINIGDNQGVPPVLNPDSDETPTEEQP